MNGLIVGVYGIYLILAGLKGNAGEVAQNVQNDAPKFLPWIVAIFVLAFVNGSSETGRKITGPFIFLLILSFVLKRFDTIKSQSIELWNMAANAKPTSGDFSGNGDKVAPAGTQSTTTQKGLSNPADIQQLLDGINSAAQGPNASDALFQLEQTFG